MKAIEVNQVSKYYRHRIWDKQTIAAIKDVQFSVEQGTIFGLFGSNGSGKTSMIKMIGGLLSPTEGDIYVLGHSITCEYDRVKDHIGVFLSGQRNLFWPLTVKENLKFYSKLRMLTSSQLQRQIDKMVELFQLEDIYHCRVSELSKEDLHKVSLAANLIHDPKILLLDEPTYGLDPSATEQLSQIIRKLVSAGDKTVILTTNDIHLLRNLCDQFLLLRNGQIDTSFDNTALQSLEYAATFYIEGDFNELSFKNGILPEPLKERILHYELINRQILRVTIKSTTELADILTYLLDHQFLLRKIRKNKVYLQDLNLK